MLKALRRIIQEVTEAENLKSALELVVHEVKEEVGTEACSIYLTDYETSEYVLSITEGLNKCMVGKMRLKFGEGLVGVVGDREEPINLDDASSHPNFRYYPGLGEESFRAYLGVPLIFQRQLLGVLAVQQKEPRRFDETEEAFLMTLATQLAVIIADLQSTHPSIKFSDEEQPAKYRETILDGIPSSPGVGIGTVVVVYPPAELEAVPDRYIENIETEVGLFLTALEATREQIKQLGESLKNSLTPAEHALFEAYLHMLDSGRLVNGVLTEIRTGRSAESALKHVVKKNVQQFEAMNDPYIKERAADVRDLGRRLLAQLQASEQKITSYPEHTVLLGEEISPTHLAEVPEGRLAGVVSMHGSSHSHVSILARALGVPTVVGISGVPLLQVEGLEAIIDGYNGQVYLAPVAETRTDFVNLIKQEQELDAEVAKLTDLPAETIDGHQITLGVNTGMLADVSRSLTVGAEGVGLYRTEVPFMMRDSFPTEEEQRLIYRRVLSAFAPRPVIMRTLDVGGDKPLPYFPIDDPNPFLGWRGIRVALDHPEIFLVQLRAMLRASIGLDNLHILLPMISSINEVEEAFRLVTQAHEEISEEEPTVKMPNLGIMIEVPSVIYQIKQLARKVSFFSVGSNDLTQYLLAVDRNNSRVANLYDSFHPAVLQVLVQVVKSAHKEKTPIGICGEMAGDPLAVILLLAMGFDSLSMSASRLPKVKWVVRAFTLKRAKALLKEVMVMDDAREIRGHLENALDEVGLGGLIRAGK